MPRDNAADPIEISDSETNSRTRRYLQPERGVGRTIPYRVHSRYDGFLTAPATSERRDRESSRSATLSDESDIEETVPAPGTSTRARMIPTIEIEDDDLDAFRELSQRELRDIERLRIRRHTSSEFESLKSARGGLEDILVKPGMCVQLVPNESNRIYFLYVKKIIKARSGQVYLRGILLKRLSDIYYGLSEMTGEGLHSVFKPELNELCMHLTYTPGKLVSPGNEECWSEVPLSDVYCERKITFTNYKHPEFNYQDQGSSTMSTYIEGRDAVKREGSLTCRWKYAEVIRNGRAMPTQFLHLRKKECDAGKGLEDPQKLKGYGKRAKGPSEPEASTKLPKPEAKTKSKLRSSFVDLTIEVSVPAARSKRRRSDDERMTDATQSEPHIQASGFKRRLLDGNRDRIVPEFQSQLPRPKRSMSTTVRKASSQYTFGDVCTGCGGTFRAAEMAGLSLDWAVDNWHAAIETLFANWPEKRIMPESIDEFLNRVKHDETFRVDVIHISFPCQPHSHMNRGQNEEQDIKNAATITALEHLLKHLRPRIVTLEQTDGILTKNEGLWFRKMIAQLTGESYNVLCERFNMAHYGVPSFRKRLIVVASCPGQELPDWPSPTYGPGLNDFVTTGDVMQEMPENDELHDIKKQQLAFEKKPSRYPMLDTDAPLQRIILTGGAKVHLRGPDGRLYRPTMRQHMRWSTFPDYHLLSHTSITDQRKQIGNAVPPKFMEQIFKQVIKALEKNDLVQQAMMFQVGPEENFMPPNQSKSLGNDDQAFWGIAAMSAAETKFPNPPDDKPQWLALAQAVFNSQALRWDRATCAGGLKWQIFTFNNGYNYKNSISNGCFFNLAARLGAYTHNETYLDWATKAWDWVDMIQLLDDKYYVYDGTNDLQNCTSINRAQWTYNAGVFLLGAAVMWDQTSGAVKDTWQTRVQGILQAIGVFFNKAGIMYEAACEPVGNCNTDQLSFKAYLSRWMAATAKVAPFTHDTILPMLQTSAQAAATSCSGDGGSICGTKWTTGTWDGSTGVGQQMSAMEVIQSTLIDSVPGPVSQGHGGISKGDPSAGTGGDEVEPLKKINTSDRAGAWISTILVLVFVVGGAWWLVS